MKTLKEYLENELSEASESEHRDMIKSFLADINRAINYIDTVKEDCNYYYYTDNWEEMTDNLLQARRLLIGNEV